MPLVPVPELGRKFALLRTYSALTRWELLAEPFGAAPKTVKYWVHGNQTRAPDQIPVAAMPVLLGLFADILPRPFADDDLRRLVFGPAARLEAELRSGAAASFADLIAREGQTGTAILIRKREESALVETDDDASRSKFARLRLGAFFRIEFPMPPACRHAAVVQGVQRIWAVVPSIISARPARRVLAPGLDGDREPRFMRERRDAGLHRFVCLQAAEPFPPAIDEQLRENTSFDKPSLDALAVFYGSLPAAQRACHVLAVMFEPDPPP